MNAPLPLPRRSFLRRSAAGLALGGLGLRSPLAVAAVLGEAHPLAPRPTHFPPRARRLVFVFLTGGFSQVDTFDYKPDLARDQGKELATVQLRGVPRAKLMPSPFRFSPRGECGLMVSELFPHLGGVADDLCVIRTLNTDIVEHFQAALAMHTGSSTVPLPSLGAWLSYGLGTLNPDLPAFVVFAEHLPYGGAQVWDSHFLPPVHQGVRIVPGDDPIPNLRSPVKDVTLRELEALMLEDLNRAHAELRPDDLQLRARAQSFRTAQGMMREVPEVFDLSRESDAALALYGIDRGDRRSFGWQCLMARRLLEKGVRVVELIDTGASDNWDAHGDMAAHVPKARRVDQALAGLIQDLKQRGLLEETLIAVCTEFGRTPTTFNGKGREHYAAAFTCLLAGAGVRGGIAYGETDAHGMAIVKDPVHVHDYHATILHLLGIDHTQLTYRYAGRDFRLTDVHGKVVQGVIV
jgi:hypothetical protein